MYYFEYNKLDLIYTYTYIEFIKKNLMKNLEHENQTVKLLLTINIIVFSLSLSLSVFSSSIF